MDFVRLETPAVGELDFNRPPLAYDMETRRDEPIAGNDEPGADSVFFSIAIEVGNDHDGLFDPLRQSFDGNGRRFRFWPRRAIDIAIGAGSAQNREEQRQD